VVSGKSFLDSAKAAETNQEDIAKAFSHHVTDIWNATNSVARVCNKRLYQAKTFSNLMPDLPVMGQANLLLYAKNIGKKWGSAIMSEKNPIQMDVTKKVDWVVVIQEMQVNEATSIGKTVATSLSTDTEGRANRNIGKKKTPAAAIPAVATEGRPNRNVGKKKTPITTEGLPNKGSKSKGKGTNSKGKSMGKPVAAPHYSQMNNSPRAAPSKPTSKSKGIKSSKSTKSTSKGKDSTDEDDNDDDDGKSKGEGKGGSGKGNDDDNDDSKSKGKSKGGSGNGDDDDNNNGKSKGKGKGGSGKGDDDDDENGKSKGKGKGGSGKAGDDDDNGDGKGKSKGSKSKGGKGKGAGDDNNDDNDDDDNDDSGKSKGKSKGSKGSKSKGSKSKLKDQSITVIQTAWRRYSVTLCYNRDLLSVLIMQCFVRCSTARIITHYQKRHRLHKDLELPWRKWCMKWTSKQ
jgi:hypothetical protein